MIRKLNKEINLQVRYGGEPGQLDQFPNREGVLTNKPPEDFIKFRIRDAVNGRYIIFPALISGITDNSTNNTTSFSYIGRADKVYVYGDYSRSISFTVDIVAQREEDIPIIWEKINYAKGLTLPKYKQFFGKTGVTDNTRPVAPIVYLTLGDMFNKQTMIFQSLNYSIDTQSTWEIQPGLRLPKLIQCSADMRLVDKRLPVATGKHFGLPWLNGDLTHGTFNADPSNPASATPDRQKYKKLWGELKPLGLTPEIATQLNVVGKSYAELKDQELSKIINNFEVDAPFSPEDLISKIG